MFDYETDILESMLDDFLVDDMYVEEETAIDPEDEMSIIEAAVDMEIAEACKKESCKKEGKGVCEKCGKPLGKCECSVKEETDDVDDIDDDDDYDDMM